MTLMWDGSFNATFTASSGTITDHYRVSVPNVNTSLEQILTGVPHPLYPFLFAESVSMEPIGDVNTATGGPKQIKMKITYKSAETGDGEPPDYPQEDLNLWTENWEAVGEAVTIGEGFHWVSDVAGAAAPQAIKNADISAVKIFPQAAFSLSGKTNRFDAAAKDLVLSTQGHTNSATITIKGYAYISDHLLFESFSSTEGQDVFGSDIHTLVYNFSYRRDNTWNEFWWDGKYKTTGGTPAGEAPRFRGIVDEDGDTPYIAAPFSDIDPANW